MPVPERSKLHVRDDVELSRITEPVTLLTDYLLAAFTLALGVRLWRINRAFAARCWASALIATAFAALAGGTFHGFIRMLSPLAAASLWKITVYLIGIAALLLGCGAILSTTRELVQRALLALIVLKFVVYAAWMARHDDFRYVIYDYAPSMVLVALLFALGYRANAPASRWVLAGIAISFAAAAIQASGFALHRHFNHNDLYHVIQMVAMYALYRGGWNCAIVSARRRSFRRGRACRDDRDR